MHKQKSHAVPTALPVARTANLPAAGYPKPPNLAGRSLLRKKQVLARIGYSNTTLYDQIKKGLFVPGINIGGRSVAWISDELDAVIAFLIAGKTPNEIRELVRELVSSRTAGTEAGQDGEPQ